MKAQLIDMTPHIRSADILAAARTRENTPKIVNMTDPERIITRDAEMLASLVYRVDGSTILISKNRYGKTGPISPEAFAELLSRYN